MDKQSADDNTSQLDSILDGAGESFADEAMANALIDFENAPTPNWQRLNRYGFQVANLQFLVPSGVYSELLTQAAIARMPNTPDYFLGITNVRGNLVPVYQLEPLVGLPVRQAKHVLLMGPLEASAALVVTDKPRMLAEDGLIQQAFTDNPALHELPALLQGAITAVATYDEEYWYTLDQHLLFERLASADFPRSQLEENHP